MSLFCVESQFYISVVVAPMRTSHSGKRHCCYLSAGVPLKDPIVRLLVPPISGFWMPMWASLLASCRPVLASTELPFPQP